MLFLKAVIMTSHEAPASMDVVFWAFLFVRFSSNSSYSFYLFLNFT